MKSAIRLLGFLMLVLWAGQQFLISGQSARQMNEGRKMQVIQDLRNQSILFMNAVHQHHRETGELPGDFSQLECNFQPCRFREKDGEIYFHQDKHWMAIRPYLDADDEVAYRCRISLDSEHASMDTRFRHCRVERTQTNNS